MTDPTPNASVEEMAIGPRVDEYHRREIPEHAWVTCRGCPAFRVYDFHYFYCRQLGDQTKPDFHLSGLARLGNTSFREVENVPCGQNLIDQEQSR